MKLLHYFMIFWRYFLARRIFISYVNFSRMNFERYSFFGLIFKFAYGFCQIWPSQYGQNVYYCLFLRFVCPNHCCCNPCYCRCSFSFCFLSILQLNYSIMSSIFYDFRTFVQIICLLHFMFCCLSYFNVPHELD